MTFTIAFLAASLVVPSMPPPEYDDCEVVTIDLVDGKPKVEWEPKVNRWTGAELEVKVKGAATLEGPWADVPAGGNPAYRFFKVVVELP